MFGRKKKELKEEHQECEAYAHDLQELRALQSEIEKERQSLKKLQDTCRQKLSELDADKEALREERARLLQEFDAETKQKREALEEEILLKKRQTEEHLQKNLTAFRDNYNYYLSQLKLLMDVLTKVSVTVSEAVLTPEDKNTSELFQTMFSTQIDPKTFLRAQQDGNSEASHGDLEEYAQSEAVLPHREETP